MAESPIVDGRADRVLCDYTNGNLTEARKAAGRLSHRGLREAAERAGHGPRAAAVIADYLKGDLEFQRSCEMLLELGKETARA